MARQDAEKLIGHALGMSRLDLYLDMERPIEERELGEIRTLIQRRGKKEPVAQIIGDVPFFGCTILVNREVLIPRVETEQLVDRIAQELKGVDLKGKRLLDLCCGSGCIGIALKKRFPMLFVTLSDISREALVVAKGNAAKNEVDVEIRQGDFLEGLKGPYDFVVCNPPYVSEKEFMQLEDDVRLFEPKGALVAPHEGLYFYEKLAKELPSILKGVLYAEIGHGQGRALLELFRQPWTNSEVLLDLTQKERFFRTVFP